MGRTPIYDKEPMYYKSKCARCNEVFANRKDVPDECPVCGCTNIENIEESV